MTTQSYYETLEEGRLLLDEARKAGINPLIGRRTGRLLVPHAVGKPYFQRALIEHEYAVKLALEQEANEE